MSFRSRPPRCCLPRLRGSADEPFATVCGAGRAPRARGSPGRPARQGRERSARPHLGVHTRSVSRRRGRGTGSRRTSVSDLGGYPRGHGRELRPPSIGWYRPARKVGHPYPGEGTGDDESVPARCLPPARHVHGNWNYRCPGKLRRHQDSGLERSGGSPGSVGCYRQVTAGPRGRQERAQSTAPAPRARATDHSKTPSRQRPRDDLPIPVLTC